MPKPTLRTALGSEVRRLRSALKLSQATLADLSGVRQATISDIEQESGNPTLDTIESLSKALKATPDLRLISKSS
jgi:transcriptional regulator with XRE-family HTH domain